MNSDMGHARPFDVDHPMQRVPSVEEMPGIWSRDGSLRDIYVHRTTIADWQWLLDRANSLGARYTFDGLAVALPSAVDIFNDRSGSHLLHFHFGDVSLHCHFFIADEIEIDVQPQEVQSEEQHRAVFRFVAELATALAKPASITPENSPEAPFAVFLPESGAWVVKR
jgi:hypothetical protein